MYAIRVCLQVYVPTSATTIHIVFLASPIDGVCVLSTKAVARGEVTGAQQSEDNLRSLEGLADVCLHRLGAINDPIVMPELDVPS